MIQGVHSQLGGVPHHGVQGAGAGDGTRELGYDVAAEILHGQVTLDQEGDGNRGVDVAPGHVADGVGHGHDHQAEGQRRADEAGRSVFRGADLPGHAAGKEHQYRGTDKLSTILTKIFHGNPSFFSKRG